MDQGSQKPQPQPPPHYFPAASQWDLPIATAVFVLGLALSVLIYRRWSSPARRT